MPVVIINGAVKGKASGLIDLYIYNLCKELGINRLRSNVIEITFQTYVDDVLGYAWGSKTDRYAEIKLARKEAKCEQRIPFNEMMQTLAHEMVHVKQYLRGELDSSGNKYKWKGRNADGWQYDNQPWEKEAYGREKALYEKCWPLLVL